MAIHSVRAKGNCDCVMTPAFDVHAKTLSQNVILGWIEGACSGMVTIGQCMFPDRISSKRSSAILRSLRKAIVRDSPVYSLFAPIQMKTRFHSVGLETIMGKIISPKKLYLCCSGEAIIIAVSLVLHLSDPSCFQPPMHAVSLRASYSLPS
jgi:hypothetical protein